MFWWRRRKAAAGKWIVVVSRVRPLDPNGGGRDELRWPEQRDAEHTADSRDAADNLAGRLTAAGRGAAWPAPGEGALHRSLT